MAEDRKIAISSSNRLGPDEVARHTFATVRRGFDPAEVRAFLEEVSRELTAAGEREQQLHEDVAEAEERAAHPVLDEETLTTAVGQETARVLRAAHDAANDMTKKAEAQASELLAEAERRETQARADAERASAEQAAALQAERDEAHRQAEQQVAARLEAVRHEAEQTLEQARTECRSMIQQAQELRTKILTDLANRRRVLHLQIEQLRAGRERLSEAVQHVRVTVDGVADELLRAEDDARQAAEAAGRTAAERDTAAATTDEGGATGGGAGADAARGGATGEGATGEIAGVAVTTEARSPTQPAGSEVTAELSSTVAEAGPSSHETIEVPARSTTRAPVAPTGGEDRATATDPEPASGEPGSAAPAPAESGPAGPAPVSPASVSPASVSPASAPEDGTAPDERDKQVEDLFARLRASGLASVPADAVRGATASTSVHGALASDQGRTVESRDRQADETRSQVQTANSPRQVASGESGNGEGGGEPTLVVARPLELIRKDELLAPVMAGLTRRLKRALQDDQNDILDRLRSMGGWKEGVLPDPPEHAARYIEASTEMLEEAARGGATFAGASTERVEDTSDLARELAEAIVGPLRRRLEEDARGEGDSDESALTEHIGAAFRDWRGTRTERLAGDHATAAFAMAALAAISQDSTIKWLVDDEGAPCPDCEDNALAEDVRPGGAFPTGHCHPPAHSGCRCLLVVPTAT